MPRGKRSGDLWRAPSHLRNLAATLVLTRVPLTSIAVITGMSYRTCQRIKRNLEVWRQPECPVLGKRGKPRRCTSAMLSKLVAYLEGRPTASLDEMARYLWDEFGVAIHRATISRRLHEYGWSRNVAQGHVEESHDVSGTSAEHVATVS